MTAVREFTLKKALSQADVNIDYRKDFSKRSETFIILMTCAQLAHSITRATARDDGAHGAGCNRLIAQLNS
ncbi:MAG TPA: hypothetical protein VIW27_10070 [Gammaproteobacteria bacterium]|jgi:hypothetical protein